MINTNKLPNWVKKNLKSLSKKGGIGPAMIKAAFITLIFVAMFFTMMPSLIHRAQLGITETATELQNTTLYGEGPAAIAADVPTYSGYFWIVAVIILIISVILGVFAMRRR